jgi:hypothetical protein
MNLNVERPRMPARSTDNPERIVFFFFFYRALVLFCARRRRRSSRSSRLVASARDLPKVKRFRTKTTSVTGFTFFRFSMVQPASGFRSVFYPRCNWSRRGFTLPRTCDTLIRGDKRALHNGVRNNTTFVKR